jgi:hypothetical protein
VLNLLIDRSPPPYRGVSLPAWSTPQKISVRIDPGRCQPIGEELYNGRAGANSYLYVQ